MDCAKKNDFILKLLLIFLFIGLLGAVKPVLFNGGSSAAKYLVKQENLKMIQETSIERYMESELFGDADLSMDAALPSYSTVEIESRVNAIYRYDSIIALSIFVLSFLVFAPNLLGKSGLYHILILISLWLFCQSVGSVLNGGKRYSDFAILAHATRWALPLIAWLGFYLKARGKALETSRVFVDFMLLSTSITFLVHGWEAYSLNPPFQDLLYSSFSMFGISISETINYSILKTVGLMDFTLAISILFFRNFKIFLWMAFWGLITALSRPLTMGLEAWPEFAMRIANCALPFVLFLTYKNSKKSLIEPNSPKMEIAYE